MNLIIEATDAAGALISGAEVTVVLSGSGITGRTDGRGQFVPGPLPSEPFQIKVTHPLYLEEEVYVIPPKGDGSFVWDNPVCTVTTPSIVIVRLSRIHAAPLFPVSDGDLERSGPFNPKAIFTWIDDAGNVTARYQGMFNNEELIVPVSHPLLPTTPTEGWGRINHGEPVKLEPNRDGNFVWLEWGLGSETPRLLVAVWIPRWHGITPSQLDFVVFFTPPTNPIDKATKKPIYPPDRFPWLQSYPYEAWKGGKLREKGPPALVQPYPALGYRYLFREKWLVYQLLAAKRQAVVVFPIQPFGDWGPFAHAAGLARLLAEVTHFLHRTAYTSGGQTSRDEDRAPSPNFRFDRITIHQPPPSLQRVVLSGFSSGVTPIVDMLGTTFGQKMNDQRFSKNGIDSHALFGADVAPFLRVWKEVWDHDARNDIRIAMDQKLPGWLRQDPMRMARCYQTHYTGSEGWIDRSPLVQFTSSSLLKPTNGLDASERHKDNRCSLVYFGQGYLLHGTSASEIAPAFWKALDDHQAVPMVTFGHAASLSGLTKS